MRISVVTLLLLLGMPAIAADIRGSADLPILERPRGAEISAYRVDEDFDRHFPQGPVRRLSGQINYEAEVRASGRRVSLTYALAAGEGHLPAFEQAREALRQQGATLLYWCQGRECGSSALWANNVFGNALLNGGDDQQAYALLRLAGEQADSLLALYGVTRGNRRAYLLVEQLQSGEPLGRLLPAPSTLLRLLRAGDSLTVPVHADGGEPDAELLGLIARTLNQDITLRVLLQGEGAGAWRDGLVASGVRATRLEAEDQSGEPLRMSKVR